jgi:very-short-patch-repair endonuclease
VDHDRPTDPGAATQRPAGPWELDFYWPDQGVVAETDGERYHMPADRERDSAEDAWLQRRHIAVLRVGEFRFEYDRQDVLDDLLGLLGLGHEA